MALVSNQAELRAALAAGESLIQVTADIPVSAQLSVVRPVTIRSLTTERVFTLSKTAGFSGSLLRVSGGGELTLQDLILDGAEAGSYQENGSNRSLVMVAGGALHVGSGTILQNNSSYQEGGGIYLSGDPAYTNALTMEGNALITGCESRTSGGGLMVALRHRGDSAVLDGQTVIENNTAANGAGIYYRSYVEGVGGALVIRGQTRISDNAAASSGGGINASGYRSGGSAPVLVSLTGRVTVEGNRGLHGAGIYFYNANSGDRLELASSVSITDNAATGNGGGIHITAPAGGADFAVSGAGLTGNTAGAGGALYLVTASGGRAELSQAIVSGNRAAGEIAGSGGGLWIQNTSPDNGLSVSLRDTILQHNEAAVQGGGLYLLAGPAEGSLTVIDSALSGNTAGTNGGGLLMGSGGGAAVTITDSRFEQNIADERGGGLYFANTGGRISSRLHISGTMVTGNRAGSEGGGLRMTSGTGTLDTLLTDCTVSDNTADTSSGGGIWQGGVNDTLRLAGNTRLVQNRSGAGNGGGVYINSGIGLLTVADHVKIIYNRADTRASTTGSHGGGICTVRSRVEIQDDAEIAFNSALKYGGGLSTSEDAQVTMTGGSIHDNVSLQQGGGVWNHGGSVFRQTGGTIYGNMARIGGGLYNDVGSTAVMEDDASFGSPQPNRVDDSAPGVYNAGYVHAAGWRDLSNGLFIESRGAAAFIDAALEPGAVIQLDASGYVAPDPRNAPIVVGEATGAYPLLQLSDAAAFLKPPQGFEGWRVSLSADRTRVLLEPEIYTITYENLMGAANTNPGSYTLYTPDIMLGPPEARPGFRFTGWFDAPQGGHPVTVIPQGSRGDLILYARWEAEGYTIAYSGNDAGGPPARGIPAPQVAAAGDTITLSGTVPVREGYGFTGWNTNPDGTGQGFQPGDDIGPVTGNIDLYAQWAAVPPTDYIITYHGNDACCPPARDIPAPQTVRGGETALLSTAFPSRKGYRFVGWNTQPDGCGDTYLPGQPLGPVTGDIHLYAQWETYRPCPCGGSCPPCP